MVFGLIFMGFWWGEYEEHDCRLEIDFCTGFDERVFWSENSIYDLESLAWFLDEPIVDLDSLDDLELNGMVEKIG